MLSLLIPLIVSSLLVTSVNCEGERVRRQFDDTKEEDTGNELGCDPGSVASTHDSCDPCIGGYYADTVLAKCEECPFDTYSDGEVNTACKPCPNGKKTRDPGTHTENLCTDVCEIPATNGAYYQLSENSAYLEANTRVYAGEEIVLQCMNQDHTVLNTEFSFLIIRCTASFNSIPLPTTCSKGNQPEEKSGLICYDSCYRERSGDTTRFVKLVGGGKVSVESCPQVECQAGKDTCVTVSYTKNEVQTVHYSCQAANLFDNEICEASGATAIKQCSVERCSTDGCNKPSKGSGSGSNELSGALLLTSLALLLLSRTSTY